MRRHDICQFLYTSAYPTEIKIYPKKCVNLGMLGPKRNQFLNCLKASKFLPKIPILPKHKCIKWQNNATLLICCWRQRRQYISNFARGNPWPWFANRLCRGTFKQIWPFQLKESYWTILSSASPSIRMILGVERSLRARKSNFAFPFTASYQVKSKSN